MNGLWACVHRGFLRITDGTWDGVLESGALFQRAAELDPNLPHASAGCAIFEILKLTFLGCAQLAAGRVDDSMLSLEQSRRVAPDQPHSYPLLAVGHVIRDEMDAAHERIAKLREISPHYSPRAHARRFAPPETLEGYMATLAVLGWQEPGE